MKKNSDNDRKTHPVRIADVKKDDLMAFVYFAKVTAKQGENLSVKNMDDEMDFGVHGKALVERGFSADQYQEEQKVTKTQAAEILVSSYNRPFTVCFEKQDGGDRTLRGRLVHPEPLLGRSMVEDLDIDPKQHRLRQVDHRTIQYIIVEGVKYIVK